MLSKVYDSPLHVISKEGEAGIVMLNYRERQSDLSYLVAIIYLLHLVGCACLCQRLKEVSIDMLRGI